MPVINTYLDPGDPTIQATGQYRGRVNVEFDDGRVISRNLRAPDEDAWSALMLTIADEVEVSVQEQDANEAVDNDIEIIATYKQSSLKQMAVAYLRRALGTQDPYIAYLKFSRFNDYRLSQGWTLDQVETALSEAGLTADEWTDMRERYQYLSNSARVTAMQAYQDVVANDPVND